METWTWWDGNTAAGITSTQGIDAAIVTDPVGQVLLQSGAPGAASSSAAWLLQDARSSTTATATGQGRVTDVTGYSDFGAPTLPTEGWAAVASFTGKASATSEGLGQFPARTYDPLAGSWLTGDPYLGSIVDPATLNRYAYVTGDPASLIDPTGNAGKGLALGHSSVSKAKKTAPPATTRNYANDEPTNPPGGRPRPTPKGASNVADTHREEQWWNPTTWSQSTWNGVQTAGAILAGVVVGIAGGIALTACIAATLGICAAPALALVVGGAVIGGAAAAVTYGLSPGEKTPEGWVNNVGWGVAIGGITGGIGPAVNGVLRAGQIAAPTVGGIGGITSTVGSISGAAAAGGRAAGAASASSTQASIKAIVSQLAPGTSSGVKVVSTQQELVELFDTLRLGGVVDDSISSYSGTMYRLPDGSLVGLRPGSTSGGATIDIFYQGGGSGKVHID